MANEITDKVTDKVESRVADQKSRAADTVNTVAQTLHSSSQQLRDQGEADVSRYIDKAADQVERVASYLQRTDVNQVVDEVENFARRQPTAFVAGAFAAGFLASRFLKSSRRDLASDVRFPQDTRMYGYEPAPGYDYSRGYGYGPRRPRAETWRESGYAAGERETSRGIVGEPSGRSTRERETDERNRGV